MNDDYKNKKITDSEYKIYSEHLIINDSDS